MDLDDQHYLNLFTMPKPVRITGRSSSITNSFVNGVIPVIVPTGAQVREALAILGMGSRTSCAYCGDPNTEWDHLRPLVVSKRPTGYISELQNLVPSCGKCNQSKGNKYWRDWMLGSARLSPSTRGVKDIDVRVALLEHYETWQTPTRLDFASVVGDELWNAHWENHIQLLNMMRESERTAALIRERVAARSVSA